MTLSYRGRIALGALVAACIAAAPLALDFSRGSAAGHAADAVAGVEHASAGETGR